MDNHMFNLLEERVMQRLEEEINDKMYMMYFRSKVSAPIRMYVLTILSEYQNLFTAQIREELASRDNKTNMKHVS